MVKAGVQIARMGGIAIPRHGTYTLDIERSTAKFTVKHMVVSTARGTLRPIEGRLTIARDIFASWVRVDFDARSFDTGNTERDELVRSQELLDVAAYPVIRFESTGLEPDGKDAFILPGDLYIKGVPCEVRLRARLTESDAVIGFAGAVVLSRSALGLRWGPVLERVGVVVSDKVHVKVAAAFTRAA
jgi:polyisoprenoid-binding protein YceI